jgi:hypothetical protein
MFGLLVLPLEAQTYLALPPVTLNVNETAANVTPPQYNDSGLGRRQETGNLGRTAYRWSIAAVLAANAADAATSWRTQEANPVVAGTGGQFGIMSVAIKSGLVGTSLLIQHIALHHRPDLYKRMAWMNLITSGVLGAVANHNMSVR